MRLAFVVASSEDRPAVLKTIEMILLLLRRSLASNPEQATIALIDRLLDASDAIRANGNTKAHLAMAVIA